MSESSSLIESKEMKNIVQEAGRTSQRGDHQHLGSMAWQPPACHGVIVEKTYMGANNPLSGPLKEDAVMTESPASLEQQNGGEE